ncbi:hypothetical protein HK096_002923, partial [Nowakowskiella sp. JEL0078]
MSVSDIVLILKKENGELKFQVSAVPSSFSTFQGKVFSKIKKDLPPGWKFTLKYKNKVSKQIFKMQDDEDVERVLSEPSSFEILVFPSDTPDNIVAVTKKSIYYILLSIFTFFWCVPNLSNLYLSESSEPAIVQSSEFADETPISDSLSNSTGSLSDVDPPITSSTNSKLSQYLTINAKIFPYQIVQ